MLRLSIEGDSGNGETPTEAGVTYNRKWWNGHSTAPMSPALTAYYNPWHWWWSSGICVTWMWSFTWLNSPLQKQKLHL